MGKIFLFFLFFISLEDSWGLRSFESSLFGKTEATENSELDPLNYILDKPLEDQSTVQEKSNIMKYVGYIREGQNLANKCEIREKINYANPNSKDRALRVLLNTYQYVGLDITTRAIAEYSTKLGINDNQYENLINNIVGNYCSSNLSTISHKELINNLKFKKDKGTGFIIPSIENYKTAPQYLLTNLFDTEDAYKKELKLSIALFRSFCSWSGDTKKIELLNIYSSNSFLAAFVIRKLLGEEIKYNNEKRLLYLSNAKESVSINCNYRICRRSNVSAFSARFPRSIGHINLKDDLERLYCSELYYKLPSISKKNITKFRWLDQTTLDERVFMNAHLNSLVTGIPDFILRSSNFKASDKVFEAQYLHSWNRWAKERSEVLSSKLNYEESLSLEIINQVSGEKSKITDFKIDILISSSEFDRMIERDDKLKTVYYINMPASFLSWIKRELKTQSLSDEKYKAYLMGRIKTQIKESVLKLEKSFIYKPWKGDLADLFSYELFEQIRVYQGHKIDKIKTIQIPVTFHYGIFAIGYINSKLRSIQYSQKLKGQESLVQTPKI